ncbi:RTA1-domain-containing protein [Clavulina sp. PMI_390]|nr:RTA1-domain-containing protein [Clavulina sp. PMI_390]
MGLVSAAQFLVVGFALALVADAKHDVPPTTNPFADPKHDLNNPLRYIPSNVLTGISVSLYFIISCTMLWLLNKSRWSARYMLCVIIGGFCMAFGLAMRFALAKKPDNSGIYIVEYMFVVLSPCAFIAGNYILLGRLSRHLDMGHRLLVSPLKITRIFVISDITTFLIQASGGGLSTSHQLTTAETGAHIFLAGLALQMASYAFFTCVYLVFLWRCWKSEEEQPDGQGRVWTRSCRVGNDGALLKEGEYRWWRDWRALAGALILSCIGILIRSVYRTIELSQGYAGPLATNEATFYGLDTLPLFVAVTIYLPFWPGRFIDEDRLRAEARNKQAETQVESGNADLESDEAKAMEEK